MVAQHGHVTIAEMLLNAEADVDRCNQSWGCSPLLQASQGGHGNLVTLLLKRGADLELPDRGGKTPLMAAAGHFSVVKSLLFHGACVDAVSGFEKVPQEIRALMNTSHMSAVEMEERKDPYKKSTAFLKACWGGHLDVVEVLLQNGCNTDVLTDFGNTALHICSLRGYDRLLHYLVERKFPLDMPNRLGETPLHTLCRQMFLIRYHYDHQGDSCSVDRKSTQNEAFEEFVRMFEVLIRSGSDVKRKDSKGRTLLYKLLTGRFHCPENSSCHLNNNSSENIINHLNNGRLYLLRFVVSATDRISFTDLPTPNEVSPELSDLHSDLLPWLMTFSRSPRSLQHIARCVVRSLSRRCNTQLPVTSVMNDYVLLNGV